MKSSILNEATAYDELASYVDDKAILDLFKNNYLTDIKTEKLINSSIDQLGTADPNENYLINYLIKYAEKYKAIPNYGTINKVFDLYNREVIDSNEDNNPVIYAKNIDNYNPSDIEFLVKTYEWLDDAEHHGGKTNTPVAQIIKRKRVAYVEDFEKITGSTLNAQYLKAADLRHAILFSDNDSLRPVDVVEKLVNALTEYIDRKTDKQKLSKNAKEAQKQKSDLNRADVEKEIRDFKSKEDLDTYLKKYSNKVDRMFILDIYDNIVAKNGGK